MPKRVEWLPRGTVFPAPDGNHGENTGEAMTPSPAAATSDRQRLSLDLAGPVSLLLDHVSGVTGVPKSQLVLGALLDALPAMLERADGLKRRHQDLTRPGKSHGAR